MAAPPQNPGSQNPAQAIDSMAAITTAHLVLMVVLAVLAVLTIAWGVVLKRRRKRARDQVDANFRTAEAHGATTEPKDHLPEAQTPAVSADVPPGEPAAAAPSPAPNAAPAPSSDLTQIKGLGPKLVAALDRCGITRIDQIAALCPAEAEALDVRLGTFQGRIHSDRWIEQARLLQAGDRAGYEAEFGKLGR